MEYIVCHMPQPHDQKGEGALQTKIVWILYILIKNWKNTEREHIHIIKLNS